MRFNAQANGRAGQPVKVLLCLWVVLALPLGATDYCVSNSGSDAASGLAPSNCWQTCSKVESFDSSPGFNGGDTISFTRSQTFTSCDLDLNSDGTSGSRITIQATGTGTRPILQGTSTGVVIDLDGASWWTVKQVRVSGNNYSSNNGIEAGVGTLIDDVEIDRHRCSGIKLNNGDNNVTVQNFDVHHNGGVVSCSDGTHSAGIRVEIGGSSTVSDFTLRDGATHDNSGTINNVHGISLGTGAADDPVITNLLFDNIEVYNNGNFSNGAATARGIHSAFCSVNSIIRNSVIRNNGSRGIRWGTGKAGCTWTSQIYRNIFYENALTGCVLFDFGQGETADGGTQTFDNNTCILTGSEQRSSFSIALTSDPDIDVSVRNNIFVQAWGTSNFIHNASWFDVDNNLYWNEPGTGNSEWGTCGDGASGWACWQGLGWDANGIWNDDPDFVSYTGGGAFSSHDFNLQAVSPAVDAGQVIPGVTDGFNGAAPDIGAIESGGGGVPGDGNDKTCVDENCVWTHNVGSGPNRALYVLTASEGTDRNPADVASDLDGSLTKIVEHDANGCTAEIWRQNAPASGLHTLTVDWNGSAADVHGSVHSIDFSGMQQVAAEATATDSEASATLISTDITPTTDGARILQAVCGTVNVTFIFGSGQSELFDAPDDLNEMTGAGSSKTLVTAALTSLTATASSTAGLTVAMAAFAPTVQAPGQTVFWLRDDGNDSNDCATYATGCATFAHIESLAPFSPGDQILLACDDKFRQEWSWITGDEGAGVVGNRIRIGKGDTGSCTAHPKISGADILADWDPPIGGAYTKSCLVEPGMMYDNGTELTRGSFGSLNEDEWDHDSGSCYLRLTGDADPDGGGHVIEAAVRDYGLQFNHGSVGGIRITDLDIEKVKDIGVVTHLGNDFLIERVSVDGAGRECFRSQSIGTDTKNYIYEDLSMTNCGRRNTSGQEQGMHFEQSGTSTGGHENLIIRGTSLGAFTITGQSGVGAPDKEAGIEIESQAASALIDRVSISGFKTGIRMTGPDGTASAGEVGDGWTLTRSDITAVGDCLFYEGLNAPNAATSYNILRDCGNRGVDTHGSTDIGTLAHNVVYAPANSCFFLSDQNGAAANPAAILKNNILLDCGDHAVEAPAGLTSFVSDRNGYFNPTNSFFSRGVGPTDETLAQWQSSTSKDANSTDQDPKFVNAVAQDFRLLPESPCRDRGELISGVTGKVDNLLPDCGKEEYLAAPGLLGPR